MCSSGHCTSTKYCGVSEGSEDGNLDDQKAGTVSLLEKAVTFEDFWSRKEVNERGHVLDAQHYAWCV